jgi:hypothetical protein
VRGLVQADKLHFDQEFLEIIALEGSAGDLQALRTACADLGAAKARPRQRNPPDRFGHPGRPVGSLDQLYIQAALLHDALLSKVSSLAAPPRCTVRPSGLKPPARSLEKLLRAHGGDASRLLDVSRHTLVCEAPADVLRCVRALADDPEIRVAGVRNSLDPARDSAWSAGFRCVRVSLALRTPAAVQLGVAGHVCEVLLVLRAFAELAGDSDGQHARYLAYRDCRQHRRPWAGALARLRDVLQTLRAAGARACSGRACDSDVPAQSAGCAVMGWAVERGGVAQGGRANRTRPEGTIRGAGPPDAEGCRPTFGFPCCLRRPPAPVQPATVVRSSSLVTSVSEDVELVLRQQLVMMAAGAGGRMSDVGPSFAQAADGSVLDTCCPIAACLCKRRFQALLCVLVAITLTSLLTSLDTMARNGAIAGRSFRLTNLMTRGELASGHRWVERLQDMAWSGGPGIEAFGLLLDGCPEPFAHVPSNSTVAGSSLLLDFSHAVAM